MVPIILLVVGPIADYASQLIAAGYLAVYNFSPVYLVLLSADFGKC